MLFLLAILNLAWTQEPQNAAAEDLSAYVNRIPKGFVDVKEVVPTIHLQISYHGNDNFTGAPLPGYGVPKAWLLPEPATALAKIQEELSWEDLSLLIYDAYRPRRASEAMVAWATRTNQMKLIEEGYIAPRSGHNHGHTVDVTIIDLKTGQLLDMGSRWDTFNETAHTKNATGTAAENRKKLQDLMEKYGFRGYSKEWWHFRYPMVGTSARDVPYSCFEVKEWTYQPPRGWDKPGYEPPTTIVPSGEKLECVSPF